MSIEQRTDVRKKTFLKGRIEFNGGQSSLDCLIRDLSETGARLELTEAIALPEVFNLHILQKDQTFRSTLRWRRDGSIGVTFSEAKKAIAVEPPMADAGMAVLLRRLHELETENAALRSVLAKLGQSAAA